MMGFANEKTRSAAPELTEKNPYRSGKCWWAWEQGFARGYALARRTAEVIAKASTPALPPGDEAR